MGIENEEYELTASGCGQAWGDIVEDGLEAAKDYFFGNELDALDCFKAFVKDPKSKLGKHWDAAEAQANLVLAGRRQYENSMINLEVTDFKIK